VYLITIIVIYFILSSERSFFFFRPSNWCDVVSLGNCVMSLTKTFFYLSAENWYFFVSLSAFWAVINVQGKFFSGQWQPQPNNHRKTLIYWISSRKVLLGDRTTLLQLKTPILSIRFKIYSMVYYFFCNPNEAFGQFKPSSIAHFWPSKRIFNLPNVEIRF
jgi:hypothetical protein